MKNPFKKKLKKTEEIEEEEEKEYRIAIETANGIGALGHPEILEINKEIYTTANISS